VLLLPVPHVQACHSTLIRQVYAVAKTILHRPRSIPTSLTEQSRLHDAVGIAGWLITYKASLIVHRAARMDLLLNELWFGRERSAVGWKRVLGGSLQLRLFWNYNLPA